MRASRSALFGLTILLALTAAEPYGSVLTTGQVRIGGVAAGTGSTIFTWQTLATEKDGQAQISSKSADLLIHPQSQFSVHREGPVLEAGSAEFTRTQPSGLYQVGRLSLSPGDSTGFGAAVDDRGRVNIAVRSGSLSVIDPSGQLLASMTAGQSLLFGVAAQEQGQSRSGGQAPGVGSEKDRDAKAATKGGSNTAIYVLIGAGAAGGIAAATLGGQKRGS
ncbi:MAG: hypothetical protein ACKV22_15640 [Bryobacteraceae bacterium]